MTARATDPTQAGGEAVLANAFGALANPVRLRILRHIASHRHCCCKDITGCLPLAQSTVSQHLKVLSDAGLIAVEARPPRSCYSVNERLLEAVAKEASAFLSGCCASRVRGKDDA